MPGNESEGVITQSDGYDSNHQAKISAWLSVSLENSFNLFFVALLWSFFPFPPVCLPLFLSLRACIHYVCFAEHGVCPLGVFIFSCRLSWHKQCI